MIIYTDVNGNERTFSVQEFADVKDEIVSQCVAGDHFRCVDRFGDYTITIMGVHDNGYEINVWDNWHILEDVDAIINKEELISFITEGGY